MTFDRLFKVALLAILSAFLYIALGLRDNGRYVYYPQTEHPAHVIDSRTGTVFLLDSEGMEGTVELHPQTGEAVVYGLWFRRGGMTKTQIFLGILGVVSLAFVVAVGFVWRRKRRLSRPSGERETPQPEVITPVVPKPEPPQSAPPRPAQADESLRQRLRIIVTYDEAKIDRLIDFERAELRRKGQPEASEQVLMTNAIERWERENR